MVVIAAEKFFIFFTFFKKPSEAQYTGFLRMGGGGKRILDEIRHKSCLLGGTSVAPCSRASRSSLEDEEDDQTKEKKQLLEKKILVSDCFMKRELRVR